MDWGNAIVDDIKIESDGSIALVGHLNLAGSVKSTSKKLTWLPNIPDLVKVILTDYDYLITKKKLDEGDNFENFVNPNSKFETVAIGDPNLRSLKVGDRIQLERRGYFICDEPYIVADKPIVLIQIPDGHTTKAQSVLTTAKDSKDQKVDAKDKQK